MQALVFLSSVVDTLVKPLIRNRPSKQNAHRRFYKQGVMTNEIEALQSSSRGEDKQLTSKPK
jgi:hypothetical protein